MVSQQDIFKPPRPEPARTKTRCIIDLDKIREELYDLANPMNGESIHHHNRVKITVKKDSKITTKVHTYYDDKGYIFVFSNKIKTQEMLDNVMAECRKTVSGW